jgi:hypothetical protein
VCSDRCRPGRRSGDEALRQFPQPLGVGRVEGVVGHRGDELVDIGRTRIDRGGNGPPGGRRRGRSRCRARAAGARAAGPGPEAADAPAGAPRRSPGPSPTPRPRRAAPADRAPSGSPARAARTSRPRRPRGAPGHRPCLPASRRGAPGALPARSPGRSEGDRDGGRRPARRAWERGPRVSVGGRGCWWAASSASAPSSDSVLRCGGSGSTVGIASGRRIGPADPCSGSALCGRRPVTRRWVGPRRR